MHTYTCTVLYNSQIVIMGGQGNSGEGQDSVMFDSWVFDIALERWQRRELRGDSVPRVAYHTQHYAKGPALIFILFGASNREPFTNTIFVASSDKMEWSKLRPAGMCMSMSMSMSIARALACACVASRDTGCGRQAFSLPSGAGTPVRRLDKIWLFSGGFRRAWAPLVTRGGSRAKISAGRSCLRRKAGRRRRVP